MKKLFSFMLTLGLLAGAHSSQAGDDPAVVGTVDFSRYAGHWFEIARYPTFFQRGCESSAADYTLLADGAVGVHNTCFSGGRQISDIKGEARVTNPAEPAKLVVDFGFFRRGDYWIIALDPDYQWAVVSGPGKSSLFILARQAPMQPKLLAGILEKLRGRGFDTSRIVFDKY